VPHPSGYPLYALWLRLWSVLPLGGAAHTAAIATAVLGAAGALTLHAAARAWGARSLAAGVAVALVALSPTVWRTYTEAEVFALAGLVAATVLWLAAPAGPARGVRRAGLLALVAGLGLAQPRHLRAAGAGRPVWHLARLARDRHAALACPRVVAGAAGARADAVPLPDGRAVHRDLVA
jgi:hypothetical protein